MSNTAASRSVLQDVDARTKLVGHNRLELLLFRLNGKQRYGMNVFKIREVISCPPLTKLPNPHAAVLGITSMRGQTFMVVDLQKALGMQATESLETCSVIVAEYNRRVQGFLVPHIEHIVNMRWEDVLAPPKVAGKEHYLTAVTRIEDELIEILDVEKVLFEITGAWSNEEYLDVADNDVEEIADAATRCHILVVDDSSVARNQITRTLSALGVGYTTCNNGKAGLDQLLAWQNTNDDILKRLVMVISDVEMPIMDGYTLTGEIRKIPELSDLTIILHTSLSGVFDSGLLDKVKADGFLSKFDSDELGQVIRSHIEKFLPRLKERGL